MRSKLGRKIIEGEEYGVVVLEFDGIEIQACFQIAGNLGQVTYTLSLSFFTFRMG